MGTCYTNENKIPGHGNDLKKIKKNIKMGITSSNTNEDTNYVNENKIPRTWKCNTN